MKFSLFSWMKFSMSCFWMCTAICNVFWFLKILNVVNKVPIKGQNTNKTDFKGEQRLECPYVCSTLLAWVTDLLLTALRIPVWSEHLLFSVFLNQANFFQSPSGHWDSDLSWCSLAFLWGETSSQVPFILALSSHCYQLCSQRDS